MLKSNTITIEKIFLFFSGLLGCFPILTFGMRSVLTFLWSVLGIYLFFKQKKRLKYPGALLIFILPFILISLSLFYSTNLKYGSGVLLQMLSFLIFPIIFYLNSDFFSKKDMYRILNFFSLYVLILVLFQIIQVFVNYESISSALTLQETKVNGFQDIHEITIQKINQIKLRRFRNFIINISNTHTTYQGLWISLTFFYLGLKFYKLKSVRLKTLLLTLIVVLILWFYLISARMPVLALFVAFVVYTFFFSKISLRKKIRISLFPPFILFVLMMFNNPISTRVKEYYKTGFFVLKETSKMNEFNSSNVRNGVYLCDLKLIKDHPYFGVGLGDVQDELNSCYKDVIGSEIYTWHTYNTHNQYLFFWISSGILGLISFLFLIVISFLIAFKNKNRLLFFLTCLTFLVFFTENILQRSDGLLFYSFFTSMLFFNKFEK